MDGTSRIGWRAAPAVCWIAAILALSILGVSILGLSAGSAVAREQRCGWIENPTPANWSLVDREREWIIGVQGGYQAPGLDDMPDLTTRGWVVTNGSSYGYGCACASVDTDAASSRITRLYGVSSKPIAACRADRTLPKR